MTQMWVGSVGLNYELTQSPDRIREGEGGKVGLKYDKCACKWEMMIMGGI